jgi:hypothetical protein
LPTGLTSDEALAGTLILATKKKMQFKEKAVITTFQSIQSGLLLSFTSF